MKESSITFYKSFFDAIKNMEYQDQCIMYNAIFNYMFNNIEPELSSHNMTIWLLIKPKMDINKRKKEIGIQYGHLGAEHGIKAKFKQEENVLVDLFELEHNKQQKRLKEIYESLKKVELDNKDFPLITNIIDQIKKIFKNERKSEGIYNAQASEGDIDYIFENTIKNTPMFYDKGLKMISNNFETIYNQVNKKEDTSWVKTYLQNK